MVMEKILLKQWNIEPSTYDIKIYTPTDYYYKYKEKGIPTDFPFAIKASELDSEDWGITFGIDLNDPMGVLIERVIHTLSKIKPDYTMDDLIDAVKNDTRSPQHIKDAVENRFLNTKSWGVFSDEGTPLSELAKSGQVTVLDVSCYATTPGGWAVKALIVGLVAKKLFIQRMLARKNEEYDDIKESTHYFTEKEVKEHLEFPLVWLVIDEAHELLPKDGHTVASAPLITILREGRQPGISLMLASQQPGKIHTDVMTQSDTVISHRITAKVDVEALGLLMQSYMREGLDVVLDNLPREKGAAIIFDDNNEKLYPFRIRPRTSWHGGEAPMAVHKGKHKFGE